MNELPLGLEREPFAPEVPVEDCDRQVSSRVSIHADLLRYDVRSSDGANVGRNPIQTAEPAPAADTTRHYCWYADEDVGAVLLQDMADFRNHRHHGAIGALVVEPEGAEASSWYGARAKISNVPAEGGGTEAREEAVLILQDGLRLFFHGNPGMPVPDEPGDAPGEAPDAEDQGQKGFNYRSEPTGEPWWLNVDEPATPVFLVPPEAKMWFRLVGGSDKPRQYSFTIHDHTWVATHISEAGRRVGSVSGVTGGWVESFDLTTPALPDDCRRADYAYRTGVLRWALPQGLWGILRVKRD